MSGRQISKLHVRAGVSALYVGNSEKQGKYHRLSGFGGGGVSINLFVSEGM